MRRGSGAEGKVKERPPTQLLDEFETFYENEELRGILNAGHTRATAFVIRCVGEQHEVRRFSIFGPKAFALIANRPFSSGACGDRRTASFSAGTATAGPPAPRRAAPQR